MNSKSPSCQRIVETSEQFVEVIASPGSGKTSTLIRRLHYLVASGVPAEQILVLSFSNATVDEVKRRIVLSAQATKTKTSARRGQPSPHDLSKITVCTAHSFANSLIKNRPPLTDKKAAILLRKAIRLLQRSCKKSTEVPRVSAATKRRRLDQLETLLTDENISQVLNLVSVAQAANKPVSEVSATARFAVLSDFTEVLCAVCKKYAALKKKLGEIDYGDMIDLGIQALAAGAPFQYTHILADEYQDCSAAQVQLLAQMAQLDNRRIMVFGDPHQGIYRFAGAGYTPLSDVLDGVREYRMPVSHRLTEETAAFASAIAGHLPKQAIQTERSGKLPVLACDESQTSQTRRVARDIEQLLDNGVPAEEIVVLTRTKAQLAPIEMRLLVQSIPTARTGVNRDHKHAVRVLKLVHTVEQCEKHGKTPKLETLQKALPSITDVDAKRWKEELSAFKKVSQSPSLEGRYMQCAKIYLRLRGGVRKDADLRADVNRWETLCRSHSSARAMRDEMRQMNPSAVVTSTIHSAKGGEWKHVFVVGVTDGLLPFYKAHGDKYAMAEERNLIYVAVTRARERVWLYHAPSNHPGSRQRFEKVSRFLRKSRVREELLLIRQH